jgi:hypothetical protein
MTSWSYSVDGYSLKTSPSNSSAASTTTLTAAASCAMRLMMDWMICRYLISVSGTRLSGAAVHLSKKWPSCPHW